LTAQFYASIPASSSVINLSRRSDKDMATALADATGLLYESPGSLQTFYKNVGFWKPAGPSDSDTYARMGGNNLALEITREQATEILHRLSRSASLPD
jgi:hypothetical protein